MSDGLYKFFRAVLIIGAIVGVIWYMSSCADSAEEKAIAKREKEDAQLIEETERDLREEIHDQLPPLEDILFDAYEPGELENDYESGHVTAEDVLKYYRELYEAIDNSMTESELYR